MDRAGPGGLSGHVSSLDATEPTIRSYIVAVCGFATASRREDGRDESCVIVTNGFRRRS